MGEGDLAGDTIAAIATPQGRGAVGVIRLSGANAAKVARRVVGSLPEPRRASLRVFRDARGQALDEGLVLYFKAPHSFTGEDVVELQGHGGFAVSQAVLQACLDAGARIAEPGEFSKRAFLEGRIDLVQAEAIADLIEASSEQAARSAMRSLAGEFSALVHEVARALVELRALVEAMLDFPEEEVDALHRDQARARLQEIEGRLNQILERSRQGSLLREGVRIVLTGRPNVGKSSLLNRLAGEERAIVTPIAGTTRDAIRESIEIEGVPVTLVDTAGLRLATDVVEQQGIKRTLDEIGRADVIVAVMDASEPQPAFLSSDEISADLRRIDVFNKLDLAPDFVPPSGAIALSAKTGEGVDSLRRRLLEIAGWRSTGESVFLARERHVRALSIAKDHIETAASRIAEWELFAEELRLAHRSLTSITGEYTADDLLGEIFARFCLGK